MLKINEFVFQHIQIKNYRKVSLKVETNGSLSLKSGISTPDSYLREFVFENRDWLEKAMNKTNELKEDFPPFFWSFQKQVPFKGQFLQLVWKPSPKKSLQITDAGFEVSFPKPNLTQKEFQKLFREFYKERASQYFTESISYWSARMNVKPTRLLIRGQRSRWGSCGSDGTVSLNWKLMAAPPEIIDYVIIHELAHLKHQDHSKKFWEFVSRFSERFRLCRGWLRKNQYGFEFLELTPTLHASRISDRNA